jgi:glycosyltransferase involved in cell wall biosynthesis
MIEGARPKLVLTTNIPTPYRAAFFPILAGVLRENGVDFEVLYYAATEPNRHWRVDLSTQGYPWKILGGVHPRLGGIYPHINPALPWTLRRCRPTWVLVAGAWNTPSSLMAASRVISGGGVRLFWSEGHPHAVLHPRGPIAALRRTVLRRFDGFAVPNRASELFVQTETRQPAVCLPLPNTVDEDFFLTRPEAERADIRRRLGVEPEDMVLLCVAELSERKGVELLATAASDLPEPLRRKVILVYAGDGPRRPHVEAAARGVRLRMLGHVTLEEIRAWSYAGDLFVLPSKTDANPLSAIEAAFCGMPLVMSARAGSIDELVGAGNCGWRIPEPESTVITDVLVEALSAPEAARRAAGARARAVALDNFSRHAVAKRFVEQLLGAFPARRSAVAVRHVHEGVA